MSRRAEIEQGLVLVRDRIDRAREAAGRSDAVDLVVVTKTFPASDVAILAELGVTDVAENRDQEARAKRAELESEGGPRVDALRWHMIGQLQRNKAASVARWADVVESVDRVEIAGALGRAAESADRTIDILIQVSLDQPPVAGRGGVDPLGAMDLAEAVSDQPGLLLLGVMGVAPHPVVAATPDVVGPGIPAEAFARLHDVADRLRERWPTADRISAGMSDDLEQAIAHGATQVRIGGAVLGHRLYVQ